MLASLLDLAKAAIEPDEQRGPVKRSYTQNYPHGTRMEPLQSPGDHTLARAFTGQLYAVLSMVSRSVMMAAKHRMYLRTKPTEGRARNRNIKKISKGQRSWLLSKANLAISDADDIEEITDHPALDALRRPNGNWTGGQLTQSRQMFQGLLGRAITQKIRRRGGRIELWPLPPQHVRPVVSEDTDIVSHYEIWTGGHYEPLATNDLIIDRHINPIDMVQGYAPASAGWIEHQTNIAIGNYTYSLMKNRSMPELIAKVKTDLSKERGARIKKWLRSFGGSNNGGPAYYNENDMELESFAHTPRDAQNIEAMKAARELVCNIFGWPPSFFSDTANRANADAGHVQASRQVTAPMLLMMEEVTNRDLVSEWPEAEGGAMFIAYDNPVPEDEAQRRETEVAHAKEGIRSRNEIRAGRGWDANTTNPLANELTIPDPNAIANFGQVNDDGGNDIAPDAEDARPAAKKALAKVAGQDTAGEEPVALGMIATLRRFFEQQGDAVVSSYVARSQRVEKSVVDDIMSAIFAVDLQSDLLARNARPFLHAAFRDGGTAAVKAMGVRSPLRLDQPEALDFLEGHTVKFGKKFADSVNRQTQILIRTQLQEGVANGETTDQIAARLRKVYSTASKDRTVLIARTETKRAIEAGRRKTYEAAGADVVKGFLWNAVGDACEYCRKMDNKVIGTGENFANKSDGFFVGEDGGRLSLEYGDVPHPPLHPRCRCVLEPVLAEDF